MGTYKELPINVKPLVKNYTCHAYINAIMLSKKFFDSDCAEVTVEHYSEKEWNVSSDRLTHTRDGNRLIFHSSESFLGMDEVFYRRCEDNDEIRISICKQIFTHPWANIEVFITEDSDEKALLKDIPSYRLGNYCSKGIFYGDRNPVCDYVDSGYDTNPITLCLRKQGSTVSAYVLYEFGEKKVVEWDCDGKKLLNIGFQVMLGNSIYWDWLYSNYIHIFYNKDSNLHLDYEANPMRNWEPYTFNYFFEYKNESRSLIEKYGISLISYIKVNIDDGNYVEYKINERLLVPKVTEANVFHQCLIYGYDDEKEELLVLDLVYGIPKKLTISYELFNSKENVGDNDKVISMVFNPDQNEFYLEGDTIVIQLRDYLEGADPHRGMQFLQAKKDYLYGIQAIQYLTTDEGLNSLIKDIRISALIAERALLMKKRLVYLLQRADIREMDYEVMSTYANQLKDKAASLCNLVLKNTVIGGGISKNRFLLMVKEIIEIEKKLYPLIIESIEIQKKLIVEEKGNE